MSSEGACRTLQMRRWTGWMDGTKEREGDVSLPAIQPPVSPGRLGMPQFTKTDESAAAMDKEGVLLNE